MATTNQLMIAFFDGIGEGITPTLDFTPQSGYPAANAGGSELFKRVRSPAADLSVVATWDLSSARNINVMAVMGTNLTSAATRRAQLATNLAISTGVVESGASLTAAFDTSLGSTYMVYAPPWGRSLIYVFDTIYSKRYARWSIADAANPDNYIEFGPARFGTGMQLSFHSWRKAPQWVGPTGSQKVVRGHEFTFANLTRDEAYNLESIANTILGTRRVLIVPEPLADETWNQDALWCVVTGVFTTERIPGMSYGDLRFTVTLSVREVGN